MLQVDLDGMSFVATVLATSSRSNRRGLDLAHDGLLIDLQPRGWMPGEASGPLSFWAKGIGKGQIIMGKWASGIYKSHYVDRLEDRELAERC